MRLHQESLLLFRLRHLRETLGFSLCGLFEYSCVIILPQIALMTQRNTASCIITQRKTGCLRLRLFCRFGVYLRLSARSAGDLLFFFGDCLSTLTWIFSRRLRRLRRRIQQVVLSRRERQFGVSVVWGFVCDYLRETLRFL